MNADPRRSGAYDPVTPCVHVTMDVVFDEDAQWDWAGSQEEHAVEQHDDDIFCVEVITLGLNEQVPAPDATPSSPSTPIIAVHQGTPGGPTTAAAAPANIQFVSPLPYPEEELDADHDEDAPLRFRAVDDIVGPGTPPGLAVRELGDARLLAVSVEEPASLAQAQQEACWRRAMEEEVRSIEENRTWTLTDLPCDQRAIGLKWVYKVKKDEHGAVIRHKARLVVKGYAQREGIDYTEVFAPVARIEAVRLLLALGAQEGWEVLHMDVKTTFLNGDLQKEMFVQQAPSFAQPGQEHKVLKLHKALYGLHQPPRAWNQKLDDQLGILGFEKCPSEHSIYCRGVGAERLVVGVYVDDLIITGTNCGSIKKFKIEMAKVFEMSDLGLLTYYLGIEVTQGEGRITLSHGNYAGKILEKAGME